MKSQRKSKTRLQSLDRNFNTRVRWESLDADYLKKLTPQELDYYAQFIDEYIGASISKNKDGTPKKGHLHKTKALAKSCYDANNRRNNDLFSVSKALNRIHSLDVTLTNTGSLRGTLKDSQAGHEDTIVERATIKNPQLQEDALIAQLDSDESSEELTFKEYIKVRKNMTIERKAQLDPMYLKENPKAYMYYYLYDNTRITDGKLDKLLGNDVLLEQFVENFELFKRKKNRPSRR